MKDQRDPSPKPILTCGYCDKQFKYKSEKDRHEQSHFPQFECDVCAKKFSFLSALRRHHKQHKRTGSVQCEKCDRKFRDETLLERHKKYAHTGTFVCSKCNVKLSSQVALQCHMKTHKPLSERKYHCSFQGCDKAFNYLHHLNHHELSHTNTKQHFCKICGKGFIQLHHLKRHLVSHEPENWLFCSEPDCKKRFITEFARKKHITTHRNNSVSEISDSNGIDKKKLKNFIGDKVLCTSCGQMVLMRQFSTHEQKCSPKQDKIQEKDWSVCPIKKENAGIILLPFKREPLEVHVDDEISEGESIIALNNGDSGKEDDFNKFDEIMLQNKINNNIVEYSKITKPFQTLLPDNNVTSGCEGCECSNIIPKQCIAKTLKINYDDKCMPVLEYRLDGVVKIKETFDFEIEEAMKLDAKDRKPKKTSETKFIPFNSCKAVLGNCIVSGNDTMGDGCFCAKMIADEQATMQEMEEITPIGLI